MSNADIAVSAGNRGALPRLRGRGEQRDIIDHCLTLSTLYIALIGELRRVPFLRGRQSTTASQARQRSTGGDRVDLVHNKHGSRGRDPSQI